MDYYFVLFDIRIVVADPDQVSVCSDVLKALCTTVSATI